MTDTGTLIAAGYGVLTVIGTLVAIGVWLSTRHRRREVDAERLRERENRWLVIVLVLLSALLLATIFFVPYDDSAGDEDQLVRVTARQFAWELEPARVRAGEPVTFDVVASDVNHSLGVYDPDEELVFQVQAMPGRRHRPVFTFDRPGTYEVLCLEFCGVGHHLMETTLEVTG